MFTLKPKVTSLDVIVAFCFILFSDVSIAARLATYNFEVSPNLKTLTVTVTPASEAAIEALVPLSNRAWERLDSSSLVGLAIEKDGLVVEPGKSLYRYSTDIGMGFKGMLLTTVFSGNKFQITNFRDWFWVPKSWSAEEIVHLVFTTEKEISVSAPWVRPPGALTGNVLLNEFMATPTMLSNKGTVVIGRLQHVSLNVANANLRVSVTTTSPDVTKH